MAYADDALLLIKADTITGLENSANTALNSIYKWGCNNKLQFNPHKTIAMLVTKKKTITPKIQMNMEDIKTVDQFSYLGVMLDKKMTFKPHLEILAKKASQFQFALARATKPTWGINSEALRTINYGAFEPMVLYCVSAFQHVLDKKNGLKIN